MPGIIKIMPIFSLALKNENNEVLILGTKKINNYLFDEFEKGKSSEMDLSLH